MTSPEHRKSIPEEKGFKKTRWLDGLIRDIELLKHDYLAETNLPKNIDYRFCISEIGKPQRLHEFSGVYSPSTRLIQIKRGYAPFEIGNINPHSDFVHYKPKPDGTLDEIIFHTHPWKENDPKHYFREPINSCRPSKEDIDSLLAARVAEEDDFNVYRTVTSLISSRGYLCMMKAEGLNYDENLIKDIGLTGHQIQLLKRLMTLLPQEHIENLAKDNSRNKLLEKVTDFYTVKSDKSKSFRDKMIQLKSEAAPLMKDEKALDILLQEIGGHFPVYPSKIFLENNGFTTHQIQTTQDMFGYSQEIFQVIEQKGLVKIE